ncbi:MAG: hypothetical protein WBD31_01145 [Rubripirellula sp.]
MRHRQKTNATKEVAIIKSAILNRAGMAQLIADDVYKKCRLAIRIKIPVGERR